MATKLSGVPQTEEKTDTPDRWVKGVLDLIKLTHQRRLVWKRTKDSAMWDDVFQAELPQKRIMLEFPPFHMLLTSGFVNVFSDKPQKPLSRTYPYLRVYSSSGADLLVSFPDIAPISALATAVREQLAQTEDSVLDEIRAQLASED